MDQNAKVILPTMMDLTMVPDPEIEGRYYLGHKYAQYEFTIEEALKYLMEENYRVHLFDNMVLQNVVLRDEMRRIGVKRLVEQLSTIVTPNDKLQRQMQIFATRWADKTLGNIDIQILPSGMPFSVDGLTFDGIEELQHSVYKSFSKYSLDTGSPTDVVPAIIPQCYVGEVWEPYPKFDSYDDCDDRCYSNFLIRTCPLQDKELEDAYSRARFSFCAIDEHTPPHLLPIVHYMGDGGFMLLAQARQ